MFRSKRQSTKSQTTKRTETTRSPAHNFAGRVGQWSANHWKTAVLRLARLRRRRRHGRQPIGTKQIDQNEANVGESRNGDRILREAGFTVDKNGESVEAQSQMVLLQSTTLTARTPPSAPRSRTPRRPCDAFPQVHEPALAAHAPDTDLISKDGHSAMVGFTPEGTYEEAVLYIDKITAAVDKVADPSSRPLRQSAGVSTEKALDKEIKGGLGKAG